MKEKERDEGLEFRSQTGRQKRTENIPGKNTHEDLDFLTGAGDTLERSTCEATGGDISRGAVAKVRSIGLWTRVGNSGEWLSGAIIRPCRNS